MPLKSPFTSRPPGRDTKPIKVFDLESINFIFALD